jgi:hypothetical protein
MDRHLQSHNPVFPMRTLRNVVLPQHTVITPLTLALKKGLLCVCVCVGREQGWTDGCICAPMYTHTEREQAPVDNSFPWQILGRHLKICCDHYILHNLLCILT